MVVLVLPGEGMEVFQPGQETLILSADDILDGSDVLPGFQLPIKKIL